MTSIPAVRFERPDVSDGAQPFASVQGWQDAAALASARPTAFLMTNSFEVGGSERQFRSLAKSSSPGGVRLICGCILRRGAFLDGLDGVVEFPLGGSFLSRQALRSFKNLVRHLRQEHVDIAHSFDFYTNLLLAPAARLARVSVVIGSLRQIGDLLTPMQFALQAGAFQLCDRVICNSRAAATRLMGLGFAENRLTIIRNGLENEAFRETPPAFPGTKRVMRVSMIARMSQSQAAKNHDIFLRAAARLVPRFSGLELLLVGDGELRHGLEQLAGTLGLGARAKFLGERKDITALLASSDFTVLPSSSESLSNAILESMAAGVPVVATRVGGNPELVEDGKTGLLVVEGNDEELAEAMSRFLSQPSFRVDCGRRAREFAQANLKMDFVRKQYEDLYDNLMREKERQKLSKPFRMSNNPGRTEHVRVALVATSMRRSIGGQGVQAALLTQHWRDDPAADVRFVAIDPPLPAWLAWIERIPGLRTLVREPFYIVDLFTALRSVEVVHIFSASYTSFLIAVAPAWLLARMLGRNVIINYRSGEAPDHLRRSRIARLILRHTHKLVVPSGFLVKVFERFGLRAEVVQNIVDMSQFHFRRRYPLTPSLVFTRGFGHYYGADTVVKAFARIRDVLPSAKLCLVGNGSQEASVRSLVRGLKLDGIDFAGLVARDRIGRYYDESDVFINASWLDNMPVSILEAFASGTPVVTTAPEGIRYIVEHERTGLLCSPGDWKALADNVIRLFREPGLAERLASNAHEVSMNYRWEAVRAKWLEVYRTTRQGGVSNQARLVASKPPVVASE